ncbi:hypothetical protein ILYODFUR_023137 [Ilyodon furcidens]|uniref:Secreted protein n=1 Tax=Ilyodon furcidens TaxID=33524 RepID=A0ABV0SRM0_9TELE
MRQLPVMSLYLLGISGARRGPVGGGHALYATAFLTLSVSRPSKMKRKRLLNDTGCQGVRGPLYIYGLCGTGGSGALKRSRAPKPSLNSKYITDRPGRGGRNRGASENHHKSCCLPGIHHTKYSRY